jgi:Protein of unknown function (DUF3237)
MPTSTLKSELLYRMTLEVGSPYDIGATPHGRRVIIPFKGGRFEGPKLRGEVLVTGGDWALARRDGAMELDIRRTLLTDDGHHIYVHYRGILTGSPENMARIGRGEGVPAADLYFRTTPVFETGSEKYDWLNRIIAVGIGETTPIGAILQVFQIL